MEPWDRRSRGAASADLIRLGGQDEVVLREAADRVGGELDPHLPPGQIDVRVVPLGLGDLAQAIDEGERLPEVGEAILLDQALAALDRPAVELAGEPPGLLRAQGRRPRLAGLAVLR